MSGHPVPRAFPNNRVKGPLRRRFEAVDRALHTLDLHRHWPRDPVLVYSSPKVASSMIAQLVPAISGRSALQFHRMLRRNRRAAASWRRSQGSTERFWYDWIGAYVHWRIRVSDQKHRWDVITGVRDPLARAVSHFFQLGEELKFLPSDGSLNTMEVRCLAKRFEDFWRFTSPDWFTEEFMPATGFDIYSEAFDPQRGYQVYERNRFRILLVRFEDIHRVGSYALSEFFGQSTAVSLPMVNASQHKGYAELYRRFMKEADLPKWLISEAYSSPQAQHFYSRAELDQRYCQWMRSP